MPASRDLPDDLQIDVQFNLAANIYVPITNLPGVNFSDPLGMSIAVTLSETLTVGAYWGSGHFGRGWAYVNSANDSIVISAVVASQPTQNQAADLGFLEFDPPGTPPAQANISGNKISSTSVSFAPTFTFEINPQPPIDSSEAAGRVTLGQLISVPVSALVLTSVTSSAPTTLTANISTPLASSASQLLFTPGPTSTRRPLLLQTWGPIRHWQR